MYSDQKYLVHPSDESFVVLARGQNARSALALGESRKARERFARGTNKSLNQGMSGGLPHSEIWGSKPIIGSPQLIADYHVLHRLLLPRHPPNALLALDPIQKNKKFIGVFAAELQTYAGLCPLKLALSGSPTGAVERRLRRQNLASQITSQTSDQKSFDRHTLWFVGVQRFLRCLERSLVLFAARCKRTRNVAPSSLSAFRRARGRHGMAPQPNQTRRLGQCILDLERL